MGIHIRLDRIEPYGRALASRTAGKPLIIPRIFVSAE
jgi:hypothetical protein